MTKDAGPLIFVVEDEAPMRRLLATTLHNHDYRVVEHASGREALEYARARTPDLVLLDLGLPDIDGLTLTRELRALTAAPIIVISARDGEDDKVSALDLGANDYVTKPFSVAELLARVRVALRAAAVVRAGEPATSFSFGDLRLDLAARRLTRGTEGIHLSPNEFKLLTVLVRRAGEVVTPKELLREVWGEASDSKRDYVRVYMHALRHKIEENPARPRYLLNEPGVGYRFSID